MSCKFVRISFNLDAFSINDIRTISSKLSKVAKQTEHDSMGSLQALSQDALLYKNFHLNPALVVEAGSGIFLDIEDGRRILDATSGAAVACLGYGNRSVQKAMVAQMDVLSYCHPGFYKAKVAEELADFLVASTGGQMTKAALVGSGA